MLEVAQAAVDVLQLAAAASVRKQLWTLMRWTVWCKTESNMNLYKVFFEDDSSSRALPGLAISLSLRSELNIISPNLQHFMSYLQQVGC